MDRVIVVTGKSGRGKSAFSNRLALLLGYEAINVGDLLAAELACSGIVPAQRTCIGPLYLDCIGQDRYVEAISAVARPGVILDGLRLAVALARLRLIHQSLFHIHLDGMPYVHKSVPQRTSDPFAEQIRLLKFDADFHFRWRGPVGELTSQLIERVVPELIGTNDLVLSSDARSSFP